MTDIILNQLYPGGVMKQLADAAGGVVYDQYAAGGCVGQLYAAAGADVTLDQYAPGGPLHQIEEEIEGGEGGGDQPDWVPANAVIHIDLVRAFNSLDAAWTEADGIVAVDTLLGADPNAENGYGETEYDPANLTADGYYADGDSLGVAGIGAVRSALLAGATYVLRSKQVIPDSPQNMGTGLVSTDGNAGIDFELLISGDQGFAGSSWNGDFDAQISSVANKSEGALNALAITLTPLRGEFAANGSDPSSSVLTEDDFPTTGDSPLSAAYITVGDGQALQSITLYDALPSTDGLSELSETGVTNTAPTSIEITSWGTTEGQMTGVSGTEATTVAGTYPGGMGITFSSPGGGMVRADPEGNPTTMSIVASSTALLRWYSGDATNPYPGNDTLGLFNVSDKDADLVLEAGVITFTLRATDPGGLYVEQEFTITVTA